eukprot:TRINITY_DN10874_c0_g1_i1.p1 TRINITY_DN10874_c0_g1~~TRINITY_DN10874_c0_g1_i1.p1  ORF type:complete len:501 (-),score=106.94 TRINITY_DN10874_c0_g1_i1:259-1761(-)
MSWLRLPAALGGVALVAASSRPFDAPSLTPTQQRIIDGANAGAAAASYRAEGQLLDIFDRDDFRIGLRFEGSHKLADTPATSLLEILKANLPTLEYTENFGLDALSRKLHPGNSAMDVETIERVGHIPTDWELKVNNSALAVNVSKPQWGIYDAAETGLYGFPEFAKPADPTPEEALERPKYIAGNLRRMPIALQRYGAYAAVLRNDVVKDRAIFIGTDSGGWENVCNKSVTPIDPHDQDIFHHLMAPCDQLGVDPATGRPVLGVRDHQMHTLLANTHTFHRVGGSLPRLLHQFLTPGASVRPIEVNMYTEAVLLGPLRVRDLKLLVASFPGIFGSEDGEKLRDFCKRHGVPLAWGLGSGRLWIDEEQLPGVLVPYEPFYKWEAGQERLLDPIAGWSATNVTGPADKDNLWTTVWEEVKQAREIYNATPAGPGSDRFKAWWARLHDLAGGIPPLRGADCASADFCFGTYTSGQGGGKDCVCRSLPPPLEAAASSAETIVV